MNKIYTILLFLIIGFVGRAQNYVPLPDSGAIWVNTLSLLQGGPQMCVLEDVTTLCVNGIDTTINANTYTKLDTCGGGYKGALRNENGKVFYVPKDSIIEFLVYDFTVSVGDTIDSVYFEVYGAPQGYLEQTIITSIDSILIFGEYRKRMHDSFGAVQWIEGIGNTLGLLISGVGISNWCQDLNCMSDNDSILWPFEGIGTCQLDLGIDLINFNFQVFPNPSSDGIFNIDFTSTSNDLNFKIITPNGQVVQEGKLKSNQIDIGTKSGIFFIQVSNGKGVLTRRIIVE
jgi:Secretion system C-terminal sorting domain